MSNKTGVIDFAAKLQSELGVEIVSTGGTARALADAGVPVTPIERITGFPEMMDGRVKTLHPNVHGGLLADRDNPDHLRQIEEAGIKAIDMVVVNLYPFEQTIAKPDCSFADAIENIDIGGPCMLRSAAKNHRHVWVICDPSCYGPVLDFLRTEHTEQEAIALRQELARMVFAQVGRYNDSIREYLGSHGPLAEVESKVLAGEAPDTLGRVSLRYGENPHQRACFKPNVGDATEPRLSDAAHVSGGKMSFNNYVDGEAARGLVAELAREADKLGKYAVAIIKHTNACGCAVGDDPIDAYRRAYLGDPVAAAGAILAMNFAVTREIAETVMNSYVSWGKAAGAAFWKIDVWIAPAFDDDALALITTPTEKRKWGAECRILAVGDLAAEPDADDLDIKKIAGGVLVQDRDLVGLNEEQWKVVTGRMPSETEMSDLRLAWLICKHTKSNAVTVCKDGMLLGNGAGQMSRVKAAEIAIDLAREHGHGDKLAGAVAATDAFFPVDDGPKVLTSAGITAIMHPGGSLADEKVATAVDETGAAMVLTGTRHFKH